MRKQGITCESEAATYVSQSASFQVSHTPAAGPHVSSPMPYDRLTLCHVIHVAPPPGAPCWCGRGVGCSVSVRTCVSADLELQGAVHDSLRRSVPPHPPHPHPPPAHFLTSPPSTCTPTLHLHSLMHLHLHTPSQCIHILSVHPHTLTCTHTRTHTRTHAHTHARTHAHTHTYILTYILTSSQAVLPSSLSCVVGGEFETSFEGLLHVVREPTTQR